MQQTTSGATVDNSRAEAARAAMSRAVSNPPATPCLILDLPDAIVELVLSHLTPWDFCRATGACKAFHSHARGVAAVRAARFGFTLPRPLAGEPVLRMLHVVESTAGWVFEVLDEDPLGNTDPWLKLEHRPSGACLNFCGTSNGWVECIRRRGSAWETAWTGGRPRNETRAWSARLMMMPLSRCTTSSCFVSSPPGVKNLTVTMATGASRCVQTECWCRQLALRRPSGADLAQRAGRDGSHAHACWSWGNVR